MRWPCLCCDGPGPGDCVICAEGYACQDQDRDGAGNCVQGEPGSSSCLDADPDDAEEDSPFEDDEETEGGLEDDEEEEMDEFDFAEDDAMLADQPTSEQHDEI
ncbi:unnamed protein product [Durusdinium trenchii]|uniref:Uncharacterized protein n=1 Tax=Durusdinium trenchii TaxID=1381693 RepID=A0ABP0QJ37_9DINO